MEFWKKDAQSKGKYVYSGVNTWKGSKEKREAKSADLDKVFG